MKPTLICLLAVTSALGQDISERQNFRNVAERYGDRRLCFVGKLVAYTDLRRETIAGTNVPLQGMRFEVLWADKSSKTSHWMHICGPPVWSTHLGPPGGVFALTLEGPAHSPAATVSDWPDCSDFYKFHPVIIEQGSVEELRQLIYDRHWHPLLLDELRTQLKDEQLFRVLYGVLTDTSLVADRSRYQRQAATYLLKFHVVCPLSPAVAVSETLESWDDSYGEWPWYLWRTFGRKTVLAALTELEKGGLSSNGYDKIELWRLWLGAGTKEVPQETVPWKYIIPPDP